MLLCQRTHKTHLNFHLVAAELSFIPKVIDCTHQTFKTYLERERSILLSVTRTLYVYQVCHGVGRCVKDGSCLSSSLEWKLMDSINGYRTISTNVRRYQTHHIWHFLLLGRQRIDAHALSVQHSPTAAALSTSFLLNHALPTAPSYTHWLQHLWRHRAAWVWVVSQKDWRNRGGTSWIMAMHWYSIWVKKMQFSCFPVCQEVQKHKLFGVAQ